MKLNKYKSSVGIVDWRARQSVPCGVFSSRTMIVIRIAMTPSLNASNRPLPIQIYQVMPAGACDPLDFFSSDRDVFQWSATFDLPGVRDEFSSGCVSGLTLV